MTYWLYIVFKVCPLLYSLLYTHQMIAFKKGEKYFLFNLKIINPLFNPLSAIALEDD